jgi:hypothetical protein
VPRYLPPPSDLTRTRIATSSMLVRCSFRFTSLSRE